MRRGPQGDSSTTNLLRRPRSLTVCGYPKSENGGPIQTTSREFAGRSTSQKIVVLSQSARTSSLISYPANERSTCAPSGTKTACGAYLARNSVMWPLSTL